MKLRWPPAVSEPGCPGSGIPRRHALQPACDISVPGAGGRRYTTWQFNAHITETRAVCYPWHPWYGRAVVIRTALVKRDRSLFHCQLEPDDRVKSLEIPQWMFEPTLCGRMRLQETPVVSSDALLWLKSLLTQVADSSATAVVQAQHSFTPAEGDADAMCPCSTANLSIRPLSFHPAGARLAGAANRGQTPGDEPPGTTTSRASPAAPQDCPYNPGDAR